MFSRDNRIFMNELDFLVINNVLALWMEQNDSEMITSTLTQLKSFSFSHSYIFPQNKYAKYRAL